MDNKYLINKFNYDLPAIYEMRVRQYIGQVYVFIENHPYLTRDNISFRNTVRNGTVAITSVIQKQVPTPERKRRFMQETVRQKNKIVDIQINRHTYYDNTVTVELIPITIRVNQEQ
jgi:hypothetical protein